MTTTFDSRGPAAAASVASAPSAARQADDGLPISFLGVLNILLARVRFVIATAAVVTAAVLLLSLLTADYTAESQFSPQVTGGQSARLAGLAAQFGVPLPVPGGSESVQFYADLLKSRQLLEDVVLTPYSVRNGADTTSLLRGTLLDLYHVRGSTERERLRRAVDLLDRRVTVADDPRANLVTVTTRAPWAELAEQINRRLLDLTNEFNLKRRQSQAGAERSFVEVQVREGQASLEAAEDDLRRFLERNRRYQDSPQLGFEMARLQRRVDLRQQVYTSLSQSYEQARIEEVRNTPVITIVDPPEGSARPRVKPMVMSLAGLLGGLVLGILGALLIERFETEQQANPDEYERLSRQLRRVWARVTRWRGSVA